MKSFVAIILPIYFLLTNSMLARSFLLKALHSSRLPGATINQSIIRPSSKTDIKTFNMGLSSSSTAASSSDRSNSKKVLVPVANGSEEIETVTIIDTLVRGGINVCVATVHSESLQVVCSRGVKLMADCHISDCIGVKFDCIVCPGGMPGAEHLRDSKALTQLLQDQKRIGGKYAAICAAPAVVLKTHGLLDGVSSATCYPADKFKSTIPNFKNEAVVVAENVITSQGPATALPFSLKLIEILVSKEKADSVAKEMLHSI